MHRSRLDINLRAETVLDYEITARNRRGVLAITSEFRLITFRVL